MDLGGIIIAEMSQTKTNTVQYQLYVESKENQIRRETVSRMVDAMPAEWRK